MSNERGTTRCYYAFADVDVYAVLDMPDHAAMTALASDGGSVTADDG